EIEATDRQGIRERRAGEIDIEAAVELRQGSPAMVTPVAAAVGRQLQPPIVGRCELEAANPPIRVAHDAVAHPTRRPAARSDDDATRHDRAVRGANRQMLETTAPDGAPPNGSQIERAKGHEASRGRPNSTRDPLEHFQKKWNPVFRPKMRQCQSGFYFRSM